MRRVFLARAVLRRSVVGVVGRRNLSDSAAMHPNFSGYTTKLEFRSTHDPFTCFRIMDERGQLLPGAVDPELPKETALKIYTKMVQLSILDSVFYDVQRQGRISFYMTSIGEEAATVGSCAALDPKDMIFAQYREVGALLWRGFTFQDCANQCTANVDDPGKGRQMPVHYGSKQLHFQTISSPLGTQLPHAAGAGYAYKLDKSPNICVTYFGEGAASEGDFHAAVNFASVTKSHTLFICRNNGYAISTPVQDQYTGDGIAGRGPGYGVKTLRADGNDLLAVYAATAACRAMVLERSEPVLLEFLSYRGGHHSTSDDASRYRPADELKHWTATNNPIKRFMYYLLSKNYITKEFDDNIRQQARVEILAALERAEARPKPRVADMFDDVYDEIPPHLEKQKKELFDHLAKHPEGYGLEQFERSK